MQRLLTLGAKRARRVEVRPKFVVGSLKDPEGIWIELYEERKDRGACPQAIAWPSEPVGSPTRRR